MALPLLWIGALKQFFRASSYGAGGVGADGWRQVNLTWTQRGALRGLAWPIAPEPGNPALVSAKDASAPRFADL